MNLKEIKDAARKAFSDQQSQDTEGGVPDGISFCAGFLAGARCILRSTKEDMLIKKEYIVVKNVENDDLLYSYGEYEMMQEEAKYLPEIEWVRIQINIRGVKWTKTN